MTDTFISDRTDKYFTKSANIVNQFGDMDVCYGVFMRRPIVVAARLAIELIKRFYPEAEIIEHFPEGTVVQPQTKTLTIKGKFSKLVELETLFLQKLGFAQVCAYNAYQMCNALPHVSFMDMHGRHGTGDDMMMAAAYGASVGSNTARLLGAKGFVGTSNEFTAHFYPNKRAMGTMPHAIVGYAAATLNAEGYGENYVRTNACLKATQMFVEANPNDTAIVSLVDYHGAEISEALQIANWFYNEAMLQNEGKVFGVRLDTHGGRFAEGLDYETSVKVVSDWLKVFPSEEYACVRRVIGDDVYDAAGDSYIDKVRKLLFGKGVSAANIINMRNQLNHAGFPNALIVASSGFDLFKCQIMQKANVPVSMVGTGSFLPKTLSETYATADIFRYNGVNTVKVGREFLFNN
jgi:nicotinate phosphoribosyltransferase